MAKRAFYDIQIDSSALGDGATDEDITRYCEACETEISTALDANVRVRPSRDGTESYTYIGPDNYTVQSQPLTENMCWLMGFVYDRGDWVA